MPCGRRNEPVGWSVSFVRAPVAVLERCSWNECAFMHSRPAFFSARVGLLLVMAVVLGCGAWSPSAQAQEVPDSTARPLGEVPPAAPDSVRPSDVADPAAADTGSGDRAIVNADSLSARMQEGERIQDLFGNVFVRQDTTRLRSDYARRFLEDDRFLFTDNVVIYERGDTLRADTVRYDKTTKVGHARGNVRVTDGDVVVRAPRATYYTESKRSVFPDSVTLIDSTRVLRARQGTYWSEDKRAEFQGHVRLIDPDTYLEADSLTYYRDTERSIATGDVFIRRGEENERSSGETADTTARTYLFGAWADNQEQERYSRVEGRALLVRVRYDSTGVPEDTLALRAHRLDAYRSDTHRRLIAVDSVRIWQADLAAVADSMVYDRVLAPGPADTSATPAPLPEEQEARMQAEGVGRQPQDALVSASDSIVSPSRTDSLRADSAAVPDTEGIAKPPDAAKGSSEDPPVADTTNLARADSTARPADTSRATARGLVPPTSSWTRPTVDSADALPLEETRLFRAPVTWFEQAQVWGDSIRVRARNRSLDTVFVRGAAFAAQRDTALDRIHQLKGRTLTAYFRADSLKRILARPNARAIRFLADEGGELSGGIETSADRIVLRFQGGSVDRVSALGGVESTLYQEPDLIPDPFRLDGFQWTPARQPTRRGLLDEPRVRRRLNLEPRRPPVTQESPAAPAPDTTISPRPLRETVRARSSASSQPSPDSTADRPERPPSSLPDSTENPARPLPDTTNQSDSDS